MRFHEERLCRISAMMSGYVGEAAADNNLIILL